MDDTNVSQPDAIEPLLSVVEASKLLGISDRGVLRLIERRELRAIAIGRRLLIEPSELRRFIGARRTEAVAS